MGGRFWTPAELRLLEETYPAAGLRGCRAVLKRSDASICNQAHRRGLMAPAQPNGHRGGNPQRWTSSPQLDEAIRRGVAEATGKGDMLLLARRLDRPRWWVSRRAAELGLMLPRLRQPPWTPEEDAIVEGYAHLKAKAIRARLKSRGFHRSATAIEVRRKRIRVGARNVNGRYTAHHVSQLLGMDPKTVMRWIREGRLVAGFRGTERLDIQGGDEREIRVEDLRRFVAENPTAVDLRKVDQVWFIAEMVTPTGARDAR